ncbi:MAG TPA: ABC transporter substrate-binding protein, partial [Lacipirellulaceae bacterium]|nr:ABC transporter substrate-binding protein [Lacipirellulaceae bacterium]
MSALHAQKSAVPVIGFLHGESLEAYAHNVAAFRQGLKEAGYVDGRDVAIEYRWGEGRNDRLPTMAAELVQRRVALIAVGGGSAARLAAKGATTTVPIVFMSAADPLKEGLVASLNRPGGNVTGVMVPSVVLDGKRLELLNELVPSGEVIAVLTNPAGTGTAAQLRDLHEAAR